MKPAILLIALIAITAAGVVGALVKPGYFYNLIFSFACLMAFYAFMSLLDAENMKETPPAVGALTVPFMLAASASCFTSSVLMLPACRDEIDGLFTALGFALPTLFSMVPLGTLIIGGAILFGGWLKPRIKSGIRRFGLIESLP